ncbi:MAG: cyclopropane-fatty-acyl-phospholipid synthase family protein [Alphaproteobacteria bacterium]|nr:cyclopropane-fatty-acyl-phospholipid synthase family protein [Alphaproteobacteria bacterium]
MNNIVSNAAEAAEIQPKAPRLGLREHIFAQSFRRIRSGRLTVEFPSGAQMTFGGAEPGPQAFIRIRNLRLASRMLVSGVIGFAEGYMHGDWDTPNLKAALMLGALNAEALSNALTPSRFAKLANRLRHARRANTKKGSRRNIAAHYDLGNTFYGCWLDETMSYSSALFDAMDESHELAQRRKYLRLAEALDLRPGDRVLEIGCGWGGFAEIAAAEFGCEVVGLTLSVEQAAFARARMARAGLADRVDIRVEDYRDVTGHFDKIVSIEMFEAVGDENWATYFDVLDRRLEPGGRAALQVITIADENYENYRRNPEFIQLYIFPGGMLPSPPAFEQAASAAGLKISDSFYFGKSYAESLRRWDRAFRETWHHIEGLGFDQRFFRMWRYYLCYCEVGFEVGRIDVGQFVIERA